MESDVSDAVSSDSFTFDGSIPEQVDQNNEDTASSTILSNGTIHPNTVGKPEKPSPYTAADVCVWQSRYIGDPLQQWDGKALLSAYKCPANVKQQSPGLFKWIHLQNQHHNLAAFSEYISSVSDLTGTESEHAIALLHLLRQKNEHSIPTAGATKGKYLETVMNTWRPSLRYSEGKEAGRVHFLCLPFFSLDSYAAHQFSNTSDTHPTRSLLQTRYPSATMERELQQAVCHLQTPDQRLCYHGPQLWCLYVENKFLITCSRFSMEETQRDLADVDMTGAPTKPLPLQTLHVTDQSGRTWLVPVTNCSTWLDFVAHFSSLTKDFESDYQIIHCEVVQKPENWQSLMVLAQKQTLRLILRSRCNSERRRRVADSDSSSSDEDTLAPESSSSPAVAGSDPTGEPNSSYSDMDGTNKDTTNRETPSHGVKAAHAKTQDVWVEEFHLFYWIAAIPKSSPNSNRSTMFEENGYLKKKGMPMTINKQQLDNRMSQIQKYITQSYRVGRRAYAQCPKSGIDEVDARAGEINRVSKGKNDHDEINSRIRNREVHLRRLERSLERREGRRRSRSEGSRSRSRSSRPTTSSSNDVEPGFLLPGTSRSLVRLAKQSFTFFLPLDSSSRMIEKYWGAVRWLLDNQVILRDFRYNHLRSLRKLRSIMQPLGRLLRQGAPPGMTNLPIELSRAWIHLLTFWALVTTKRSTKTLEAELDKCRSLLESGRIKLLRARAPNPLHHYEAAVPSGIVSLLVNKMAGDAVNGQPDIEATYYAYVTKLEQEVQQKPYSRGHQEKITAVRQEINCVLAVLLDQSTNIDRFRWTLMKGKLDAPPSFPQRREAYILQNCILAINDRIQNFRALDERARGIAAFNLYRIESNRDRQEGAILVFTIVTIIFLPLSFVSSFFGMNTSDIRSMSTPQWVFWASALPLTTIVVGVSIFVARNIEPVKDWWSSLADRWRVRSGLGAGSGAVAQAANVVFPPAPQQQGVVVPQQPLPPGRMMSNYAHQQRPQQWPSWEDHLGPRRRPTGGYRYGGVYDA